MINKVTAYKRHNPINVGMARMAWIQKEHSITADLKCKPLFSSKCSKLFHNQELRIILI